MIDFPVMALQCGSGMPTEALYRIVSTESSFNPYAIGVVGGRLSRQPISKREAVATALYLENANWNFSVGLAQINRYNLPKYGLDYESAFEPCANLRAAASIYTECFNRAAKTSDSATARLKAFSCYYSGNFSRGFLSDGKNGSYVQKILRVDMNKLQPLGGAINVIPARKLKKQNSSAQEKRKMQGGDNVRRLYRLSEHNAREGIKQLRGK